MEKIRFSADPIVLLKIYAETCISKRVVDATCVEDRVKLKLLQKVTDDDIAQILVDWHNKTNRTVIDVPDMIKLEEELERLIIKRDDYEQTLLDFANNTFIVYVYSRFDRRIMSHGVCCHYEGVLAAAESFFGEPDISDYSKDDIYQWIVENVICCGTMLSVDAYAKRIADDVGR